MQLKDGSNLQNGKYRIIRVLGQGGFGITYLAENTLLDRKVAIKEFFPKDYCGRDATSHITLGTENNAETVSRLKARFLKEAKNIAKLDHPGIIKIHDIFEENNTAYYVMDYIEGDNLNNIVKQNGPFSEQKAIEYIQKVGEALEYIHSRQMTHFDVKPANIMVRRSDDTPILIDFGLSKQYDQNGDATSTLLQGVSHGYSPIELYNAGNITSFSPQTDVYSLGATLLFLVTGCVPPTSSDILNDGLTFPSSASASLQTAIESAMEPSSRKRPSSIAQFIDAIVPHASLDSSIPTDDNESQITVADESTHLINPTSKPTAESPTSEKGPSGKKLLLWTGVITIVISFCAYYILSMHSEPSPRHKSYMAIPARPPENAINTLNVVMGEGYVDLGLPSRTKWSSCNLGASRAESIGKYYFFGKHIDIYKESFENPENYDLVEALNGANFIKLLTSYDGRIPSKEEFEELKNKCNWSWSSIEGQTGYIITGPNNRSIFLPAGGYIYNKIWYKGQNGSYWIGDDISLRLCFSQSGIVIDKNLDVPMTMRLVQNE